MCEENSDLFAMPSEILTDELNAVWGNWGWGKWGGYGQNKTDLKKWNLGDRDALHYLLYFCTCFKNVLQV